MSSRRPRLWRFRLEDILASIARMQEYTRDMDFDGFQQDRKTLEAVERNFILIGEAAARVPEAVTARFPDVPWGMMRDMRNVIVHFYWGVDVDRLWSTIHNDLPPLVPLVTRVLDEAEE